MNANLQIINLEGNDPIFWGYQHGETLRDKIKEFSKIRMERTIALSTFKSEKEVLNIAQKHLGLLLSYDKNLYNELAALSKASKVSLEHLVVLNNYTDLRDIKIIGKDNNFTGCSMIYSPHSSVLGQTWDMHGSAADYLILLKMNGSVWFTLTGCLGMAGINSYGVGIGINNLNSLDARVGVIWPAIVRKALTHKTAKNAKDEIMTSFIGSGHHYAVADKNDFFAIETSGRTKDLFCQNPSENYFHTNHCLDKIIEEKSYIRAGSSTVCRYRYLKNNFSSKKFTNAEEVFLAFEGVSMPYNEASPHDTATCGTFVMDLQYNRVITCKDSPKKEFLTWPQVILHL